MFLLFSGLKNKCDFPVQVTWQQLGRGDVHLELSYHCPLLEKFGTAASSAENQILIEQGSGAWWSPWDSLCWHSWNSLGPSPGWHLSLGFPWKAEPEPQVCMEVVILENDPWEQEGKTSKGLL